MAAVLLCHDERLDRRVAVKRLHADSPGDVEQRFVREAKLGASLNHPNLVAVFDTEADDEGVLIVMEYVQGESLARRSWRGPLEPGQVAAVARRPGRGARPRARPGRGAPRRQAGQRAAARGRRSRSWWTSGSPMAADQTRMTRSGTVLGSAAYMAPEQLEGGEVGPRRDVYALAAVCFEALGGRAARDRGGRRWRSRTDRHGRPARRARPRPGAAGRPRPRRWPAGWPASRPTASGPPASWRTSWRGALERPSEPPTAADARECRRPRPASVRTGALAARALLALLAAAAVVAAVVCSGGGGDDRAGAAASGRPAAASAASRPTRGERRQASPRPPPTARGPRRSIPRAACSSTSRASS